MKRPAGWGFAAAVVAAASLATAGHSVAAAATPAAYRADAAQSHLGFIGVQAGAEFKANFRQFAATVQFAPDSLATAAIDVTIDLGSVDSQDKDRDTTIRGPDIFDTAHWPTARYVTRSFAKTATGFSAVGSLTLRGVTKDVPIEFQWIAAGAGAKLVGTAKLRRLDFGAGQGDWKSTQWIADEVKIDFSLVLAPR
jgi:polyisoprenoid-binding protein YceI